MNFKGMVFNAVASRKNGKTQGEASRHARRALRQRISFSETVFIATLVFLFLPLAMLVVHSFNDSAGANWTGFSLRWYQRLLESRELWRAFGNSIIIAITSAVTATVLGTLGAVGVSWYRFRLRSYAETISFLPMILPEIIIGVSLSLFFTGIGIDRGLLTIYIAHTTFNLPFVFLMVKARLDEFDFSIIEAAQDLGASEKQALFRVTVPLCMPGIMSGLLTAITLSLEDFVITFFVAGPGSSTLPIFIQSVITRRGGILPMISALSVVMILGTVLLCLALRNFLRYIASK